MRRYGFVPASILIDNAVAAVTALENNIAVDDTNFTVVSGMADNQSLAVADFQRAILIDFHIADDIRWPGELD